MRLITWNINSIRLRIGLLRRLVEEVRPDVVCLQETKVPDELFPLDEVRAMGFEHVLFHGMKSYNGVAILSRYPLAEARTPSWCDKSDCRHLVARLGEAEIHCLYVPAGGDIPDPDLNPKFAHKLGFLREVTSWYGETYQAADKVVLVGDLNIAPLETDVWSHRQLLGVVSHTPVEVEALARMQDSVAWVDAVRHFIPPSEHLYTWWSYRSADWKRNDRGRRLDHVWVTPALQERLRGAMVIREARDWPQPSDHVPVVVDLDLEVGGVA